MREGLSRRELLRAVSAGCVAVGTGTRLRATRWPKRL
ncbi:twin-arginine translocation signal domain-containing protein [Thioalkalivibrio sp.]